MKNRRILIYTLIGLGIVIASCVIVGTLLPCAGCKAEKEIGVRYGFEGHVNVEGLSAYFDRQVVKGQPKDELFAFFRKGNPNAIYPYPVFGTSYDVPNASCYKVRFDDLLGGNLLLNRFICFDGNNELIFIERELDLY